MKRYAEYRDSGIEWIGKIPFQWEVKKLKALGTVKGRIGFKGYTVSDLVDEETEGRAIVLGGTNIMKAGYVSFDKLTYISEFKFFESPEIMLSGGEILITKVGAGTGENAIYEYFEERVTINPNVMIFIANNKDYAKYINYYLLSNFIKCDISLESNKSGAQPAINQEYVKNIKVTIPSLKEQKDIVKYIDARIDQIDSLIADKQKLINLLREKRQATISEAVTSGIDKTVKMKDSGIDWIGEIPAHWDVLSNHQLFAERNQKNTDANAELLSVTKYLGVILQSLAQELRLATTAPADSTEGYKVVKKGDLVMNIMRAKDGSYGISSYDGVISPAYCIYQARKKCNPQFLYYLFKTPKYVQIFKCYSTGIAEHRMRLYPEDFNQIPAILPPIVEQDEIVKKLDAESKQIDEVIALAEQQVEKLKEYRLSIISEVVTGKVVV